MRKRIEWKWEILDDFTKRAKVIGGWIVRNEWGQNKNGLALASTFVADRDHEWEILVPIPVEPEKDDVF